MSAEAVLGLQGVDDEDKAHEQSAKHIAKAFREDKKNPVEDRFEVATLAERTELRGKFGGKVYVNNGPELELLADKLRQEFGDTTEVFNFYASVARSADMGTARSVANKLVRAPNVNPEAKAEAGAILARHAQIGKTLDIILTTIEGQTLDLAQTNKPTVLFFWPASSPTSVGRLKGSLPADTQVIYVSPGANAAQITEAKKHTRVPGAFCS